MASENSIYRKIQIVLDIAVSAKVASIGDLQAEIRDRRPPNFITKKYDSQRDIPVTDVSDRSIRRTVGFCYLLGLLSSDGSLTEAGRQAVRRTLFNGIVAGQVRSYLIKGGINLFELNKIILNNLQCNPPVLPTCRELWGATTSQIHYPVFLRMMTLLAQCGAAHSSQKKIYLHITPD